MSESRSDKAEQYAKWLSIILDIPWIGLTVEAWKLGQKILRGFVEEGIYEVLDYEVTLELKDERGARATVSKRKQIRYLQNGVIAYTDHAWGDGKTLLDYKCSPGIAVDRYHVGYNTYILLSLREVKNRGDEDEFNIQWKIKDGFLKPDGFWDTDITNRTRQVKMNIIFPKTRPPNRFILEESNRKRTYPLQSDVKRQLPDGRWVISWQTDKPHLFEHYLLRWWW